MRKHWSEKLKALNACEEAVAWAATQRTSTAAWKSCTRADWMLWLAGRVKNPDTVSLVRCAVAFARSVLHLVPEGEGRPRLAIEAAEEWVKHPSSEAAYAAADAAADAANAAAYAAADAAADAAAYVAAYVAAAAAFAADAAAAARAADIVRQFFPKCPKF